MSIRVTDEPEQPVGSIPQSEGGRTSAPPSTLRALLIGGGLLVLVIIGSALLWPRQPAPTLQPTAAPSIAQAPTAPPATAAPLPSATPAPSPYLAMLSGVSAKGDWKSCVTTAEGALTTTGLSEVDRKAITGYAVTCGLKDLYNAPFEPLDRAGQQALVDRYLTIRQRATDAGIAIDTPLVVARSAFTSSQFQLTRVALEEALKDGSWKPATDRDVTKLYISTLYGLGKWYTGAPSDSLLYKEGLGWLSASDLLQRTYQTGQGDAAQLLSTLGYPDRTAYPKPAPTPLENSS